MKHSLEELLAVAYRYYPRGVAYDDPRYEESVEQARLVTLRGTAGAARAPWRALLQRLGEALPENQVFDELGTCPADWLRAAYEGWVGMPKAADEHDHTVGFRVSFVVPYYAIYSTHTVDDHDQTEALRDKHRHHVATSIGDVGWRLPREALAPQVLAQVAPSSSERQPVRRRDIRSDLSPEERPFAAVVAREIEATYGYEPMPPDIGNAIVPAVATGFRALGTATIYDCLFSENW